MKGFNPVFRIGLEDNPGKIGSIENDVLTIIKNLESKAKVIRKQGKDPHRELALEVEDLQSRVYSTNIREAEYYRNAVKEVKNEYHKSMEDNPQLELMRLQQAQLRFNSMDDKQLEDAKVKGTFDYYEMQMMQSKFGSEDQTLNETIKETRKDMPYLNTPEKNELLDKAIQFENSEDGLIIQGGLVPVLRLIDLDGTLDEPA